MNSSLCDALHCSSDDDLLENLDCSSNVAGLQLQRALIQVLKEYRLAQFCIELIKQYNEHEIIFYYHSSGLRAPGLTSL